MKTPLIFFLALLSFSAFSQENEDHFFIFDKTWQPVTEIKKADYFLRVRKTMDSNYEWTYYKIFGPRIKKECFKDEKATIRNGKYIYYYDNGFTDSLGEYLDGELNGSWYYHNQKGKLERQKDYNKGVLIKDTSFDVTENNNNNNNKLLPGEVESEYPGGIKSWQQYLMKNLHYPDRALSKEVMGDVRLQFIVETDGSITETEIDRSVEYSLDEEALRIINQSQKWIPASKDGRKVRSYKRQPINFRLTTR